MNSNIVNSIYRASVLWAAVATSLFAQQHTPAVASGEKQFAPADVPMATPVIVISNAYFPGYCEPREKSPSTGKVIPPNDCIITREAFERLFNAVPKPSGIDNALDAPAAMRRSVATTYATMIGWSKEAERRGLEKSPVVQEQLRLARVQILERALKEELKKEYEHPTLSTIQDYYKDNAGAFTELSLERVLIPQVGDPDPTNPSAERLKYTMEDAEKFRARVVNGESPEAIQAEIWKALHKKGDPPRVSATRRHNTMRPEQEATVFSLKVGEVSPVLPETLNFVFYKVVGRKQLPLDEVKEEISRALAAQATEDAASKLNEKYRFKLGEVYFQTAPRTADDPEPPVSLPSPVPSK